MTTTIHISRTNEQVVPNTTVTLPVQGNITESLNETITELLTTTADTVTTTLMQTTTNEPTTTTTTMLSVTYSDSIPTTVANLTSSVVGNSTIITDSVNVTASDIVEIVTLASGDTTTLVTTLSSTSTSLSPTTIAESTQLIQNTTLPSVTTNNYSESIFSTLISSVDGNSTELHKDTLISTEKTSCNYIPLQSLSSIEVFIFFFKFCSCRLRCNWIYISGDIYHSWHIPSCRPVFVQSKKEAELFGSTIGNNCKQIVSFCFTLFVRPIYVDQRFFTRISP